MRWVTVMGIFLLAGVSVASMVHVKTDLTQLVEKRSILLKEQKYLKESLRVQRAEWAHLTRPERLNMLARQIGFSPVSTSQIVPVSLQKSLGE